MFDWNYTDRTRIKVNQGGTSSGKTYAILQVIFMRLIEKKQIGTVVGQDIPNLKKGALRDFQDRILPSIPWFNLYIKSYNKTDRIYKLTNGSILEFTSYKDEQDAKNGKRDILFVNECNGVPWPIVNQLLMRTSEEAFFDYNPTTSFWAHEKLIGSKDVVTFYSNFTHNPYADESVIKHVRGYKESDPESWEVYGLGKTGNVKGVIFKGVTVVPEFPEEARNIIYGLDFGFTNDQTALVELGQLHGRTYGKELIYELGMLNSDIVDRLKELGIKKTDEIIADSAEPKSIKEIRNAGYNVRAAKKGPDSVKFGIGLIKQLKFSISSDSTNWRKERNNYKWKEDKDGNTLNVPVDSWNHCWDAARYAATYKYGERTSFMKFAKSTR